MARPNKGLDLNLLDQSLKEKTSVDRDVYRMVSLAKNMSKETDVFTVVENEDEEIIIMNGSSLPTDEEIEQMKRDLAAEDAKKAVPVVQVSTEKDSVFTRIVDWFMSWQW